MKPEAEVFGSAAGAGSCRELTAVKKKIDGHKKNLLSYRIISHFDLTLFRWSKNRASFSFVCVKKY
jgi:hypothetical protein